MASGDTAIEMDERGAAASENVQAGSAGSSSKDPSAMEENELTTPNSASDRFLNTFAKLIPKLFLATAVGVLALWIVGLAKEPDASWGILPLNLIVSLFGAWGVYQYGVIMDQIDELKRQNEAFESEINGLKQNREELQSAVQELNAEVGTLQKSAGELEENTKAFEPLLKELGDVAKDSEEIAAIIDSTNNIFSDMRTSVLKNERAALLSIFYQSAFRDDDDKMSKREYRRFLGKLTSKQRAKFEAQGTFEEIAGDDGEIDLNEFQGLLENVLKDVDDMLRAELGGGSDDEDDEKGRD